MWPLYLNSACTLFYFFGLKYLFLGTFGFALIKWFVSFSSFHVNVSGNIYEKTLRISKTKALLALKKKVLMQSNLLWTWFLILPVTLSLKSLLIFGSVLIWHSYWPGKKGKFWTFQDVEGFTLTEILQFVRLVCLQSALFVWLTSNINKTEWTILCFIS